VNSENFLSTTTPRSVAIMQPTYFPWAGYFALMDVVDAFVFLDDVQLAKRSWQQRNRIKTANGVQWLTVPVASKGKQDQLLADARIEAERGFPSKHRKSLEHAYVKAPHFERYAPALFEILESGIDSLCDLNAQVIAYLAQCLGVDTPLIFSSELREPGKRTGHLVNICKAMRAGAYVSPSGSMAYMEGDSSFADNGMELFFLTYEPAPYAQLYGEYVSHLSAIDLVFNMGPQSGETLRRGTAELFHSVDGHTELMRLDEAKERLA